MTDWNTKLIQAYRVLSSPYRKFWCRRMSRVGKMPVMSLFYHRVADDHPNPWSMTCGEFEQQISWFQKNFDLVSLEECQRRIVSGVNDRPALAITFDDGYAENCEFAIPLLLERKIPFTYFVTTEHTIGQKPFPHDVERDCPLATNTAEALRAMADAGVDIGAHTRTHVDLGKVEDEEVLVDEVISATLEMENVIGRPIRYFAFPFGQKCNLNDKVFNLLREAGFLGVCSAYGGWNDIGGDAFHIQRIHGDPNFERIKNWLTYDPRIAKVHRYMPENCSVDSRMLAQAKEDVQRQRSAYPAAVTFPNVDLPQVSHTTHSP